MEHVFMFVVGLLILLGVLTAILRLVWFFCVLIFVMVLINYSNEHQSQQPQIKHATYLIENTKPVISYNPELLEVMQKSVLDTDINN
jgi:uncharacterized membrane protein YphA (DoxX/SURF4 family)